MMKRFTLLALLACVCVLPAHATTLTFVSNPTGDIGPYLMSLNGGPAVPMICYSDLNGIQPTTWNVEGLTVGADLGGVDGVVGTSFGESTLAATITEYDELGYLAAKLFAAPGTYELQEAIWTVSNLGGVCDSTCEADITTASTAVTGGYTTADTFYVPINGNGTVNTNAEQPFIYQAAEPGLLLMLGSGLLGLIGLSVRRRNLVSC